ncbi:MAG: flagellar FliJ family protein [Aliarcobacter sp.]|nr:flagellar FliJ family protein [Aliarcobacter sp.]
MQKSQLESKIEQLNAEILLTQNRINTAGVQKHGAISDFMILTIHKNTMKTHIQELSNEKSKINLIIEDIVKEIVELQKETEQFGYLLEEERKEAIKKILKEEAEASDEYIQSKYIQRTNINE